MPGRAVVMSPGTVISTKAELRARAGRFALFSADVKDTVIFVSAIAGASGLRRRTPQARSTTGRLGPRSALKMHVFHLAVTF
jgi:hypothetical protein